MKKSVLILFVLSSLINPLTKADEGMWLPMFIDRLNYVDMQKMGLQLTPEEIYSINNSSLKDAIIIFGRGCTGEIVSDQGLVFTNHHCGFGQIQAHSTVEHDYLKNGFWAMKKSEELANPGLTAKFLVSMEDVTSKVLTEVKESMTEVERKDAIRAIIKKLSDEATKDTHYDAEIKSFFMGNEYYMFLYETYKDVRLVGAPPSSIGKFGADTDNWMWPRHTGDFSIFRIYSGPDGKPAEYAEDNIPLKPKHFLPVSLKGVKKGDFSMILGYPGSTERYLTSYGVKMALDFRNPSIVKIRDKKLAIMREVMDANEAVKIQYASKYARTANYWKYFIGQSKGLKRLKVYDKKQVLEADLQKWADADEIRKAKYGNALNDISSAYDQLRKYELQKWYFFDGIARGSEIIGFSRNFESLVKVLSSENPDTKKISGVTEKLKKETAAFFKDYHKPIDITLMAAMLEMFYKEVPSEFHPAYLKMIAKKYKGDFNKYAQKLFEKSIFDDQQSVEALLNNPNAKSITNDEAYKLMKAFFDNYITLLKETQSANTLLEKGNRHFMAGLREMDPDKKFYPDANFTMRFTYGTVQDYFPADAIHFNYYTTLAGVIEKEDPTNYEFVVSDKLEELYNEKDYGRYGYKDTMYVCFLTNHDITGGNSGSPVINGKGELIGLAFDGNWEAMSGDIAFEPEFQRTINVDIRYVLFVIDKYAGATNIVDELVITRNMRLRKEDAERLELDPAEISN